MFQRCVMVVVGAALLMGRPGGLVGAEIAVPGGSFESPKTPFVSINIDHWQKTPKPDWYVETNGFTWTQLTGAFKNTPAGSSDHIANCDGAQAIWVFAVPEVGLFQDHESVDWNDPEPSRAFDATFEPERSYRLTVGVIGGGGGMLEGVPLELSLHYRDDASNRVTVASTTVLHSRATFPTNTHLVDFHVDVPRVEAADAWAGRHIGVQIVSTVGTNLQGGYWDVDNVRLTASSMPPALTTPVLAESRFHFAVQSDPGRTLEVYATTNLALPFDQWTRVATLTNDSGSIPFSVPATNGVSQFYQVKELP